MRAADCSITAISGAHADAGSAHGTSRTPCPQTTRTACTNGWYRARCSRCRARWCPVRRTTTGIWTNCVPWQQQPRTSHRSLIGDVGTRHLARADRRAAAQCDGTGRRSRADHRQIAPPGRSSAVRRCWRSPARTTRRSTWPGHAARPQNSVRRCPTKRADMIAPRLRCRRTACTLLQRSRAEGIDMGGSQIDAEIARLVIVPTARRGPGPPPAQPAWACARASHRSVRS